MLSDAPFVFDYKLSAEKKSVVIAMAPLVALVIDKLQRLIAKKVHSFVDYKLGLVITRSK